MTEETAAHGLGARYARTALVPGWDQGRLGRATAVLVGVGALGTEVARLLARAGIGALILCDPDRVEESNLSRGALFTPDDIGSAKVEAAAAALLRTHPETSVRTRFSDFRNGIGLGELASADLVLSCLDSIADRIALAARCSLAGAGLLDAGTHPWGGEVRYFPAGGSCYACGCTPAERSADTWHVTCADPPEQVGASAPISSLVASWQATQAVRLLFGAPVEAGAVRIEPTTGQAAQVALPRDPACPCHRSLPPEAVSATGLGHHAKVSELLALVAPGELALSWHSIVPGDPLGPTALTAADPQATLAELGIPPGEVLPVVRPPRGVRYLALELEAVP